MVLAQKRKVTSQMVTTGCIYPDDYDQNNISYGCVTMMLQVDGLGWVGYAQYPGGVMYRAG